MSPFIAHGMQAQLQLTSCRVVTKHQWQGASNSWQTCKPVRAAADQRQKFTLDLQSQFAEPNHQTRQQIRADERVEEVRKFTQDKM